MFFFVMLQRKILKLIMRKFFDFLGVFFSGGGFAKKLERMSKLYDGS